MNCLHLIIAIMTTALLAFDRCGKRTLFKQASWGRSATRGARLENSDDTWCANGAAPHVSGRYCRCRPGAKAFDISQVGAMGVAGHQKPATGRKGRRVMRKVIITAAMTLTFALFCSAVWPTAEPDVEHLGDSVYETIWIWRIPAYANNPSWRVRWSWSDPLRAQARCCRALPTGSVPRENPSMLLSTRDIRI